MNTYVIITDASVDLIPEELALDFVDVLPMEILWGMEAWSYSPRDKDFSYGAFYERFSQTTDCLPSTTMIQSNRYIDGFKKYLDQGLDFIYLSLSSGMSGTYYQALQAVESLKKDYPDRKMYALDSLQASTPLGQLLSLAIANRQAGMSLEDNVKNLEEWKYRVVSIALPEDLFHLHRGGRLSKSSAILGSALRIKPVLEINKQGSMALKGKERGDRRLIRLVKEAFKAQGQEGASVYISHGNNLERAEAFKKAFEEVGASPVHLLPLTPIVGCHLGSGALAIGFIERQA
ncbi:MAG: DegV family protein [Tissierellia bacterium]|nr:DegV family protein [Tissierellia bacterium]